MAEAGHSRHRNPASAITRHPRPNQLGRRQHAHGPGYHGDGRYDHDFTG